MRLRNVCMTSEGQQERIDDKDKFILIFIIGFIDEIR